MNKEIVPFGLLFEEQIDQDENIIEPIYDEIEGINMIIDENGNHCPYVEVAGVGHSGTKTETRIQSEDSDFDESVSHLGTRTVTHVAVETSDLDPTESLCLSNKPSAFSYSMFQLGTRTVTKAAGETTSTDD
jgi:hypothetical protein